MKASKISVILAVVVLFAATAFAASNKASLEIPKDVTVGGKTLAAGSYTITWEGQGQNVDLSILHHKQVVVKTSAHIVDMPQASLSDAVVMSANADGTSSISQIRLGGKKYVLQVGGPASQVDVASGAK